MAIEEKITDDRYGKVINVKKEIDASFFAVELQDRLWGRLSDEQVRDMDKFFLRSKNMWTIQEIDSKKGYRISVIDADYKNIIEVKLPLLTKENFVDYDSVRDLDIITPEINFYGFNRIAA